ncbi:MAG: HesA/MoeB/ThiF family protein [Saccharolobus sp.]
MTFLLALSAIRLNLFNSSNDIGDPSLPPFSIGTTSDPNSTKKHLFLNIILHYYFVERYSRQLLILGLDLQQTLNELKVLIAGCGALGSAISELLARLGVGEITVVDADVVDITNLHRTHLFTEDDIGRPKAEVCAKKISQINSSIKASYIIDIIDEKNIEKIMENNNYIFDGLDNLYYKLLLNDAAIKMGIPLVYGGINGEYGSAKLIIPHSTACLSCFIHYEDNDTQNACDIIGVTPLIVELTATVQVNLMLNHLRGINDDYLYYIDSREVKIEKIRVERNPFCKSCSLGKLPFLNKEVPKPSCGIFRTDLKVDPNIDKPKISKSTTSTIICYPKIGCFEKRGR